MTTVYLIRHSMPFRKFLGTYDASDTEQLRNEKNILCVEGEERARKMSEISLLCDIDVLYSSHYVRAMSTAKYISLKNRIPLNVDERFGERKFGVQTIKDLPSDFHERQFKDWNYKIATGESLNETSKRMKDALLDILQKYSGKNIAIVSHGTAISVMLKEWCEVKYNDKTKLVELYFQGKKVFDGDWDVPELFQLNFENEKLISIQNIKF